MEKTLDAGNQLTLYAIWLTEAWCPRRLYFSLAMFVPVEALLVSPGESPILDTSQTLRLKSLEDVTMTSAMSDHLQSVTQSL